MIRFSSMTPIIHRIDTIAKGRYNGVNLVSWETDLISEADERRFRLLIANGAPDECWPFMGHWNEKGYGRIRFRDKIRYAHRLAWELTNGPIPDGMNVLHRCDYPACCNPAHLFLGTLLDNVADMIAKGRQSRGEAKSLRQPKGEAHRRSKLTQVQVEEIKVSKDLGTDLAKRFGVGTSQISRIRRGESWRP